MTPAFRTRGSATQDMFITAALFKALCYSVSVDKSVIDTLAVKYQILQHLLLKHVFIQGCFTEQKHRISGTFTKQI